MDEYRDFLVKMEALTQRVEALEKEIRQRERPAEQTPYQGFVRVDRRGMPRRRPGYTPPGTIDQIPPQFMAPPEGPAAGNKRLEAKIGKQVMSVAASVLIFFSFILFAGVAYRYLTDAMKVLLMYALSVGFAAFGLWKMDRAHPYYVLFTSLAGCGIGAFYLSCVIAHFGFGIIGRFTLLCLIFLWIVGVSYLSGRKSVVFAYICYIGILFATYLCEVDAPGAWLAMVCYLLGTGILFAFNFKKGGGSDFFYFLQYPCVMTVLSFVHNVSPYRRSAVVNVLTVASLLAVYIARHYLYEDTEEKQTRLQLLFTMAAMYIVCLFLLAESRVLGIVCIWASALALAGWSVYTHKTGALAKIPYFAALILLPWLPYGGAILPAGVYHAYIYVLPFAVVYFVLGLAGRSVYTRLIACVCMLRYTARMAGTETAAFALACAAVMTVVYALYTYRFEVDVRPPDKYILLASAVFTAARSAELLPPAWECLTLIPLIAVSAFANSESFRNTDEDWDFARTVGYILNLALMCICTVELWQLDGTAGKRAFLVLCAVAAYMINSFNLLAQTENETPAGIYVCLKATFLLYLILRSIGQTGVVLSLLGMLLAIAFIVLGFRIKRRALRVYGLFLSMTAVIKIILLDISYGSALLRPVGFFAAGMLCFGISCIYSRLEKSVKQEE